MQWYYTFQGQRQGPVDDAGLEDLVRQGVIRDDTYVWREGLAEWQLYGAVKPRPMPAPTPAPAPPPRPIDNPAQGGGGFGAPPPAEPYSPRPPYVAPAPAAATAGAESKAFFYYPVLRALSDGRVIRICVVWGLKIGAVAVALGGLLSAFEVFSASQGFGGSGMLGAVLMGVLLLGTSLCVGQVCWYRAGSVAELGEDSSYTLIPITSILFRTGAECGATGFAGLGVGACLFLLLSPGDLANIVLRSLLPIGLPISSGFVGGILALVYFGLLALMSLISGYFMAEWIGVLVDIAESIHKIRRVAEKT